MMRKSVPGFSVAAQRSKRSAKSTTVHLGRSGKISQPALYFAKIVDWPRVSAPIVCAGKPGS